MEIVKSTKALRDAYWKYNKSNYNGIYDAYDRPSYAKVKAWEYCRDLCENLKGSNLKVVGFNMFKFSAGFTFNMDNKKYFMYITDTSDRAVEVED